MIRRFLGIFQPQIVPRPRRGGFHRLAVRTCSITAHSAPVMFHTLKNNNPSFDRRRLSRRRSSLPLSPSLRRKIDDLFIYLFTRPRRRAATPESHHSPHSPTLFTLEQDGPKDRSSLPVEQLQLRGGNCLGGAGGGGGSTGIVFTGNKGYSIDE